MTALISSNMQLHALHTGRQAKTVTAMTMLKQYLFKYQGHVGAALVLGGVDESGPNLFTIAPHGSTDKLPYVTMGSGSLAAMAVFEQPKSGWRAGMTRDEAIALVVAAIEAGIFNDLGSGSNVDVVVVKKDETEVLRNFVKPNERVAKEQRYNVPKGVTPITKETIWSMVVKEGELECIHELQVLAADRSYSSQTSWIWESQLQRPGRAMRWTNRSSVCVLVPMRCVSEILPAHICALVGQASRERDALAVAALRSLDYSSRLTVKLGMHTRVSVE